MIFHDMAHMKLSCATLYLLNSTFVGNGTIEVGRGPAYPLVDVAHVLVNTFSGVWLGFNGKSSLRNNAAVVQL